MLLSPFITDIPMQTIPPDHKPHNMTLCTVHVKAVGEMKPQNVWEVPFVLELFTRTPYNNVWKCSSFLQFMNISLFNLLYFT